MHRKQIDYSEKEAAKAANQTDEEAEQFMANTDLTESDFSEFRTVLFEFQPESERVNMRLPKTLLDAVTVSAARAGVPYQRLIRQALEAAVRSSAKSEST